MNKKTKKTKNNLIRKISNYSLKKASEHVFYEIWMFYEVTTILQTTTTDQLHKNILLESFAIHARNLFDFFYPKRKHKDDDILVTNYIKNTKSYNLEKSKKKSLLYLVRKADKQVVHLTYSRNRYHLKIKGWKFKDISDKFKPTIISFYNNLSGRMKKWDNFVELNKLLTSLTLYK